jgi:hypothetical protein
MKLTIKGLLPNVTVGVWRTTDVSAHGEAKNPIYLGQPRKQEFEIKTHWAGEVLIRCRHKLYTRFSTTVQLERNTAVSVVMNPDGVITSEDPALPEFVDALALWLEEQGYVVNRGDGEWGAQVKHFIHVGDGIDQYVVECYLYTIKGTNFIGEWYDPEVFPKLKATIDEYRKAAREKHRKE